MRSATEPLGQQLAWFRRQLALESPATDSWVTAPATAEMIGGQDSEVLAALRAALSDLQPDIRPGAAAATVLGRLPSSLGMGGIADAGRSDLLCAAGNAAMDAVGRDKQLNA